MRDISVNELDIVSGGDLAADEAAAAALANQIVNKYGFLPEGAEEWIALGVYAGYIGYSAWAAYDAMVIAWAQHSVLMYMEYQRQEVLYYTQQQSMA